MSGLPVWYWVAWGAMFLAGEGYALFNRTPGDTLSEQVWYWLLGYRWAHPTKGMDQVKPGRKSVSVTLRHISTNRTHALLPIEAKSAWTWRTFMVGAFLLWLFFHLTFGWFAG